MNEESITEQQRNAIIDDLRSGEGCSAAGLSNRHMCFISDVCLVAEEEGFAECTACGGFFDETDLDAYGECEECEGESDGYDEDDDYNDEDEEEEDDE